MPGVLATRATVCCGGGGGAGGVGQGATSAKGGDGGVGITSTISGATVYYGGGGGGSLRFGGVATWVLVDSVVVPLQQAPAGMGPLIPVAVAVPVTEVVARAFPALVVRALSSFVTLMTVK